MTTTFDNNPTPSGAYSRGRAPHQAHTARRAVRGAALVGVALLSVGCAHDSADSAPSTTVVTQSASESAPVTFGAGTHRVGDDIAPGTYRAAHAGESCYWERLSGFTGAFEDIIANDNAQGTAIVTILPSDHGFTSRGCGTWELLDEGDNASAAASAAVSAAASTTPQPQQPSPQKQLTPQAPATPAQQAGADGPVGFTGDPYRETPHVLDGKRIASCLSTTDPLSYQPGTTLFTDGTTGWTAECAAEYVPPAPSGGTGTVGAGAVETVDATTGGAGTGEEYGDY
ncbi:hypothetical protein C1Y63_05485 [Corynebacterium sp. 13CS0277]|nr:hypothetical protein C1Y63_05485 [Corynebacterium sp. 13CS0277]